MAVFTETPSTTLSLVTSILSSRGMVEKPSTPIVFGIPFAVSILSRGVWRDDFNRANSNTISDASHPWIENENAATAIQILANQLRMLSDEAADRAGFAYWDQDPGAHHYSELEFKANNAGLVNPRSGPAARIQTTSTHTSFTGYVAVADPSGGEVVLRKYVSQSLLTVPLAGTILGTAAVSFAAGSKLRIEAVLQTITVRFNGVVVIEVSDSAITGGRPGMATIPGYSLG